MNINARARRAVGTIAAGTLLVAGLAAVSAPLASAAPPAPVSGAVSTTINANADLDVAGGVTLEDLCKNGNPEVNCNQYGDKSYVWLSGLPDSAGVNDGTYFFAVVVPGGQGANATANPNDGTDKNLSDTVAAPWTSGDLNADGTAVGSGDAYTNRTFTVTNGVISYSGSHTFDDNKIRLMPYDDTTNPGGVYILAVCKIAGDLDTALGLPGVNPSTCKYDAFMVRTGDEERPPAADLTVVKDAEGSYDTTYAWEIDKSVVGPDEIKKVGGNATFNYKVEVTHDDGTVSDIKVTGEITVTNPNDAAVTGVDIDDVLSDGTVCTVTGGTDATIPGSAGGEPGEATFAYECDLSALPADDEPLSNVVTVTWPDQDLGDAGYLLGGYAQNMFEEIVFTGTDVNGCVVVDDSFHLSTVAAPAGTVLATVCADGTSSGVSASNPAVSVAYAAATATTPGTFTLTYGRTVPVPTYGCVQYDNTATFTATDDDEVTGEDSASVTVCGPINTGAKTMGFWQNNNGQRIVAGAGTPSGSTVCKLTPFLRGYAPFQDLSATAPCGTAVTSLNGGVKTDTVTRYVYSVIKAANASGASMNAMLKAQMLATALDVYFSDPANGNPLGAPQALGGVTIDLTAICADAAACSSFEDVSSAFGGATYATVSQLLAYAASQSNQGGSYWYENVKSVQELAKDTFDAINNNKVFAP